MSDMMPRPTRPEVSLDPAAFAYLQHLMHRRSGVVLEAGKEYMVETRLAGLADREGYASVRDLLDSLRTEEEWGVLHRRVVESLLIGETSFFRDLYPFEALRDQVLPDLIERRAHERTLHLWCASCSTGQEPYSLAILLREHFPQLSSWNVRLIASDLSLSVLSRAREGRYSQMEINRGLSASLLVRHFEKVDGDWRVREPIRRMVEFRELNLVGAWPSLPAMDVVLLRNVLLYFDVPTRKTVLRNLTRCLKPDGVLLLGSAETTLTLDAGIEAQPAGKAMLHRLAPARKEVLP